MCLKATQCTPFCIRQAKLSSQTPTTHRASFFFVPLRPALPHCVFVFSSASSKTYSSRQKETELPPQQVWKAVMSVPVTPHSYPSKARSAFRAHSTQQRNASLQMTVLRWGASRSYSLQVSKFTISSQHVTDFEVLPLQEQSSARELPKKALQSWYACQRLAIKARSQERITLGRELST